jgi:penicillin-insensitive murein DD-endopeptidase
MMRVSCGLLLLVLVAGVVGPALAQDSGSPDPTPPGTLHPAPLPPLANPSAPSTPAKELFGRKTTPTAGAARSIGSYADGCLAGGEALPISGLDWQVMRLSRNRNWGNPRLIAFIERFAKAARKIGWNGLLIGDMSQPRGGPMLSGHGSHQIGLDVDIWFKPMPDHVLSREEREFDSADDVVAPDRLGVDPKVWTHTYTELLRVAAQDPEVARIFVNAAIKKEICKEQAGSHWQWLAKVRPWWGHAEHFHVRLDCPPGSRTCKPQPPPNSADLGCGHELDFWFTEGARYPKPPAQPRRGPTMKQLPTACRKVLAAP